MEKVIENEKTMSVNYRVGSPLERKSLKLDQYKELEYFVDMSNNKTLLSKKKELLEIKKLQIEGKKQGIT